MKEITAINTTGSIIRRYRIEKGLQQKELAEKLHTTYSYMSKIERDESAPSDKTLKAFYNLFNVTLKEKEEITFYEEFRKAGPLVKNNYIQMKKELEFLKKRLNDNNLGLRILTAFKEIEVDFYKEKSSEDF